VITCDVNPIGYPEDTCFDRAVSMETFGHVRNFDTFQARVAS
jgi:hypothetical protein